MPDAHLTGEHWILGPADIKFIGSIEVGEAFGRGHEYTYGDGLKAKLYDWEYTPSKPTFFFQIT